MRGLGLFLGIELVKDRQTASGRRTRRRRSCTRPFRRGLSFKTHMGNILTLTPALTITRPEMDQALAIIEECIAEVEKGDVH